MVVADPLVAKSFIRFLLLLCTLLGAQTISSPVRALADESDAAKVAHDRIAALAEDVGRKASAGQSVDSRDLGNAAFTILLHGGDPATTEADLDRVFAKQISQTESADFGQIPWRTGDAGITDYNAAPFFAQGLGAVLAGYSNRLSPGYVAAIRPKVAALAFALERHPVAVSYTNIYLARAIDLLILGHYLGDRLVEQNGRDALRTWIAQTRVQGINEFDSATYYAADLEALSECYRFAPDAVDRTTCRVALDYFWTDIAANYMPAAHKLSGPSSREYDFISGNDDLAYWTEAVGWDPISQLPTANLQAAYIEDFLTNGGYKPPDTLRGLAFGPPRDVTSTYDENQGHTRFNWVGQNVSLGCAGGSYGPQDKMLVATFAGPAKSAQLNVLLQKSGVAYGVRTSTIKPEHVSPTLGCVEQGGALIANFDVDMHLLGATPHGFETDVLFPLNASLTVNGQPVSLAHGDLSIGPNDILAIASGGGVVALRAIRMDDVGATPTLTLTTDPPARARGAAWLRIVHVPPGGTPAPNSILRETFIMIARDDGSAAAATADLARAAPQDDVGPVNWISSATFPQGHFELVRSSTKRGTIYLGSIDGRYVQRPAFGIDRQDTATAIWQGLPY
jgi:hypothetical protein